MLLEDGGDKEAVGRCYDEMVVPGFYNGISALMRNLICGDSVHIMPGLADESVDLIVTDPPYGLHFMGKDWDKAVPSVDIWRQCLRVLKPGAFAFVMSIPRMDCLSEMGKRLGEAGFEIGFTPIFWAYASGFPKAMNIGKAVDKRGVWNDEFDEVRAWLRKRVKAKGLAHKQIDAALGNKNSHMASHFLGTSQPLLPNAEQWEIIKGLLGVDERLDTPPKYTAFEREIIGYRKVNRGVAFTSEGPDKLPITNPASPQAQALDGSYAGFQPKPAVEVVIVAMKPKEHGTYIDQALDNRKGVTWLDDCKIPIQEHGEDARLGGKGSWTTTVEQGVYGGGKGIPRGTIASDERGRFPANLLVEDDVVDDGIERKTGDLRWVSTSHFGTQPPSERNHKGDSGGFSRYFSLDAWWAEKLKELPESVQRTFPFLVVPKAGKKEKNLGCGGLHGHKVKNLDGSDSGWGQTYPDGKPRPRHKVQNHHPTVKPLKLMSYLITLGSRPGDLVLDPFAGTCTTAMAAKVLGRRWLMIEISEEWCQIGKRRVDAVPSSLL